MSATVTAHAPSRSQRDSISRSFDIDDLRLEHTGRVWVLEGRAPCYDAKKRAGLALSRIVGQASVVNRLRVVPNGGRDDGALAEAVRSALAAHQIPAGVMVTAKDAVVTLSGRLAAKADGSAAELAAWSVRGVANVVSRLRIVSAAATKGRGPRMESTEQQGRGTHRAHGYDTTGGIPTAGI